VSIFQIQSAQHTDSDGFFVDGKELGTVCLVGRVAEVDSKTTKKSYKIEDHTGTMDVSQWVEETDGGDSEPVIQEYMYVRVIGHVKSFKDNVSVNAFYVSPIASGNEVTQHILDVTLQHLKNTRGAIGGAPGGSGGGGGGGGGAAMLGQKAGGGLAGAPAVGGQFAYQQQVQAEVGVGNPVQNAVLSAVKESADESGVSVSSITSSLAGRFNEQQIREALDFLSNEGHVYSTIDDEHYASTDA
jgi:replication factor A2